MFCRASVFDALCDMALASLTEREKGYRQGLEAAAKVCEERCRALEQDARRYRWLRSQHWNDSELCCVTNPKETVLLGTHCPSEHTLDSILDAAIKEGK